MKTVFIRAIEAAPERKGDEILDALRAWSTAVFAVDTATFGDVPKSPFAYWTGDALRKCFKTFPSLHTNGRTAKQGLATADDFRFARLSTEISLSDRGCRWFPFAKGGSFSRFYADVYLVTNWDSGGYEMYAFNGIPYGTFGAPMRNPQFYFRPGLTWSLRTQGGLSMRLMARGCVFGHKGPAAFVEDDDPLSLLALVAVANSQAFAALVDMQMAFGSYEVGVIQRTPVPDLTIADRNLLADLAHRSWSHKRRLDTRSENSHAFLLPGLLQADGDSLIGRAQSWAQITAAVQSELDVISAEVEDYAYRLYGISAEDRHRIQQSFGTCGELEESPADDDDDEADEGAAEVDALPMVASLLSWSVGVAFGRFDVRLATRERTAPPEPEPFAPLPVCSPGMLTGDDGLPVDAPPPSYPLNFPSDGILVDDPGHPRDLLKAVRAVFDEVFDNANARWHEAAELVGARGGDLRDWFARTFFGEHIKRYRKSRRKAPIYWQLATASGSYAVWVYIHRATPDTLFRVLNDFVSPKLDHEREKLDRMTRDAGPNPSRTGRDALAAQEAFVDELQALRAELARVAPLWKPDLDDGVILNFAPLWRLVQQDRSWQAECRKTWDKLCAGEYDWAHLAMHLWPERAVLKCAEDRSLAIAHGLETVFWRQDGGGNWHAVSVSAATVRKLIDERTSSSVKAALKDLLTAPGPTGKSGGRRSPSTPARTRAPRRTAPAMSTLARTPTVDVDDDVDEATLTVVRAAIASAAEGATKADVQATTGLSDADWNRSIAELLERGDVTRTGQKRGTRYHAVPRSER